jgi:hypothetical protein
MATGHWMAVDGPPGRACRLINIHDHLGFLQAFQSSQEGSLPVFKRFLLHIMSWKFQLANNTAAHLCQQKSPSAEAN